MHLSHPLLALPAALLCWVAASVGTASMPTHPNPMGLQRSAYGSLVARLMKDSLHAYWHGGRTEKPGTHVHDANCKHPEPSDDHGHKHDANCKHEHLAAHAEESWLEQSTEWLAELEAHRTERNSPFATSPAHRRFLNASADWRLYLAYQLDPGDAALYEIGHFIVMSHAPTQDAAREAAEKLARQTIDHALAPESGLADALTGAGAVINLFNDQLQPDRPMPPNPARLHRDWLTLNQCLTRYRTLHYEAHQENWWEDIPEVRRQEIESYAAFLDKIATTIHSQLAGKWAVR